MTSDELLTGSIRGVTISFREAGRTGGRKTVFHTYPNSDVTLAEDLGKASVVLRIIIVIYGASLNYYSRRDAIISALESKGTTILAHPTYGQLNVQIEGNYSINERIDSLGYSEISVSFKIVDNKKFLEADTDTSSYIATLRDSISSSLENTFMANLYVKAVNSYETVASYTSTFTTLAENIASGSFTTLNDYNSYTAMLSGLITYYPSKLSNLGSNISSIFTTLSNTVTDPLDEFSFFTNFFDFLDTATSYSSTTKDLYYTQNNQDAYKAFIQGTSLAYAMNAASNIEYETDTELQDAITTVMDQFEEVIELPFINPEEEVVQIDTTRDLTSDFTAVAPIEIYNNLQNQKVAFLEVMKEKALDVPKVTSVTVANESLTNLVYKYYGDLDNYDTIRDLNSLEETSLLTGTYNILMA